MRMDEFELIYERLTTETISQYEVNPEMKDVDMRTSLRACGWDKPKNSLDSSIEWLFVDFESGDRAERLSTIQNVAIEHIINDFGKDHHCVNDQRGLSLIPQELFSQLNSECFKFKQIVKSI